MNSRVDSVAHHVALILTAKLRKERGIGFEDLIFHIERGDLLDILERPNRDRYAGQHIFSSSATSNVYLVPFPPSPRQFTPGLRSPLGLVACNGSSITRISATKHQVHRQQRSLATVIGAGEQSERHFERRNDVPEGLMSRAVFFWKLPDAIRATAICASRVGETNRR